MSEYYGYEKITTVKDKIAAVSGSLAMLVGTAGAIFYNAGESKLAIDCLLGGAMLTGTSFVSLIASGFEKRKKAKQNNNKQ